MHLKPGSVAVIASDGVVSDGRDEWLRRLLSDSDDRDMKRWRAASCARRSANTDAATT